MKKIERKEKEIVKEFRSQTGMNQKQFAEYFGIPVRTLQEWEQGRQKPSSHMMAMMERIWRLEHQDFSDYISRTSLRNHIGQEELLAYLTKKDIQTCELFVDEDGELYFTEEQGRAMSALYIVMRRFVEDFPSVEVKFGK